jgi:hypothetical protein
MPAFAGVVRTHPDDARKKEMGRDRTHPDDARKQEMGRDRGDENWEEGKNQEEKRISARPTTHPSTLQHY